MTDIIMLILMGVIEVAALIIFYIMVLEPEYLWPKRVTIWKLRNGKLTVSERFAKEKRNKETKDTTLRIRNEKDCSIPLTGVTWNFKSCRFGRYKDLLLIHSPTEGDYRIIRPMIKTVEGSKNLNEIEFEIIPANLKLWYANEIKQNLVLAGEEKDWKDKLLSMAWVFAPILFIIAIVILRNSDWQLYQKVVGAIAGATTGATP